MMEIKDMKTVIEWNDITKELPVHNFGWYFVILKPVNFDELENDNQSYADWVQSYGLEKAWLNGYKWWIADSHGYGTKEVTKRVMYFSKPILNIVERQDRM